MMNYVQDRSPRTLCRDYVVQNLAGSDGKEEQEALNEKRLSLIESVLSSEDAKCNEENILSASYRKLLEMMEILDSELQNATSSLYPKPLRENAEASLLDEVQTKINASRDKLSHITRGMREVKPNSSALMIKGRKITRTNAFASAMRKTISAYNTFKLEKEIDPSVICPINTNDDILECAAIYFQMKTILMMCDKKSASETSAFERNFKAYEKYFLDFLLENIYKCVHENLADISVYGLALTIIDGAELLISKMTKKFEFSSYAIPHSSDYVKKVKAFESLCDDMVKSYGTHWEIIMKLSPRGYKGIIMYMENIFKDSLKPCIDHTLSYGECSGTYERLNTLMLLHSTMLRFKEAVTDMAKKLHIPHNELQLVLDRLASLFEDPFFPYLKVYFDNELKYFNSILDKALLSRESLDQIIERYNINLTKSHNANILKVVIVAHTDCLLRTERLSLKKTKLGNVFCLSSRLYDRIREDLVAPMLNNVCEKISSNVLSFQVEDLEPLEFALDVKRLLDAHYSHIISHLITRTSGESVAFFESKKKFENLVSGCRVRIIQDLMKSLWDRLASLVSAKNEGCLQDPVIQNCASQKCRKVIECCSKAWDMASRLISERDLVQLFNKIAADLHSMLPEYIGDPVPGDSKALHEREKRIKYLRVDSMEYENFFACKNVPNAAGIFRAMQERLDLLLEGDSIRG